MRNKILFLVMLFMTAGAVMYGVDKSEELKKLEAQRQELTWKIVDKRAELISSNPDLKQLHDQMNAEAEALDQQIAELKK